MPEQRKPRTFNAEPPGDVHAVFDGDGRRVERRGSGWWYVATSSGERRPEPINGEGWRWEPSAIAFPLTEVLPTPTLRENSVAEAAAADAADRAYNKMFVRYGTFVFAPSAVVLSVTAWIFVCAALAIGELSTWVAWAGALALAPMVAMMFVSAASIARAGKSARSSVEPSFAELSTGTEWLWRLLSLPVVPLAAYHLVHDGWPTVAAYAVGVVGWLGTDLSTVLSLPGRRVLHRLLDMKQPLPRNNSGI
ncbi:hypothetical protein [Amycolatopsis sp. NPDC058986]|uniref:hypothetical protein n=1 Tax=unclassified Amycolatopsis TaxID=2618356 RepID=UPI00366D2DD5